MIPAINCERVTFGYSQSQVLTDATFSVSLGSFTGIIGPNGGGKTTLLRLIMGFLEPRWGSIRIFGLPPSESQELMAYVPQNLKYDRHFPVSVFELVLQGRLSRLSWLGRFSNEDTAAAERALDLVGIHHCKNEAVGNLSGGQFQRALIARALVSNPKLLILDEPTANVDSQAEKDIYSLLKDLAGTITILMVTHDLHVAVEIVDSILLVQNSVTPLQPSEVCNHFAMGLYHPPLRGKQ